MKKEIKTSSREAMQKEGHAVFNSGKHSLIDMSDVSPGNDQTVIIQLPNGDYVTLAIMNALGPSEGTVDIAYRGDAQHSMIGITTEGDQKIKQANIYSLNYKQKGSD